MSTPKTIRVFLDGAGWMAEFAGDDTFELFGTNTLPTPFLAAADPAEVLRIIGKANPEYVVSGRGDGS